MGNNVQAQVIVMSLQPLFESAEAENLWFYHNSVEEGEVWYSPQQLREVQGEGRCIWSPEHWELRSPIDYMKLLHIKTEALVNEYNDMAERLHLPHVLLLEKQDMIPVVSETGA